MIDANATFVLKCEDAPLEVSGGQRLFEVTFVLQLFRKALLARNLECVVQFDDATPVFLSLISREEVYFNAIFRNNQVQDCLKTLDHILWARQVENA